MKIVLDSAYYNFNPTAQTLDFSSLASFQQNRLFAVINTDDSSGVLIYSTAGGASLGGTFSGSVLTFNFDTTAMNPASQLSVIYDDPAADQVISNETTQYDSSTITGTPSNAINNSANGIYCAPYRTAYAQVTQSSGAARMQPEGSMDGNIWYALPSRVIGSTGNPVSSATDWTTPGGDIIAIPLDCNYVRLRTLSNPGNFRVVTYFTQQQYASPWAFQMLLSNSGRIADWGSGTSSAQTLRVIPSSDATISIPDLNITGTGQSVVSINLLTGTTSATDVSLYRAISFQIIGTAGVTGGQFWPEQSNDNVNWQACVYYQNNSATPSVLTTATSVSASFNQVYQAALTCRYFRLRISSTITGSSTPTITAYARLTPMSHSTGIVPITGTVSASSATISSTSFTDISDTLSTATTTTSGASSLSNIGTFTLGLRVTAFTGTSYDVRIEESFDSGNTFIPLYQFERITGTGTFYSPPLRATGTNIRYVRVTTGGTVSITSSVSRIARQFGSSYIKNLVDRTLAPNTINSTSAVLMTEGLEKFQLIVSSGAGATVNPVIKLQGSEDNSNWYDMSGMSVTAAPSVVVSANSGTAEEMPKFVRAIVSTAGTSATMNYLVIKGMGRS